MVEVMSKRITINVPDDVAERLQREPNVSAYVTEAIRGRMRGESTRAALEAAGFRFTEEGLRKARERYEAGKAAMTPEFLAKSRDAFEQMRHQK